MIHVTNSALKSDLKKKSTLHEALERKKHPSRNVFIVDLTTAHKFHSKDAKTAKAKRTIVRYLRQP